MSRIAGLSPDDARMVLRICRQVMESGILEKKNRIPPRVILDTIEPYHVVRNTSGEAIPPFGCMQMVGTSEIGGRNYLDVDQPADSDGTAGGFLFNGPNEIEIGGNGIGFAGPVVRALSDGTAVSAGQLWSPQATSWQIAPNASGLFRASGPDDIASNVIRVQVVGGGGSGSVARTDVSGITARSTTTAGTGTATLQYLNGDTITAESGTITVRNWAGSAVAADAYIFVQQDRRGVWWAVSEDCPLPEEEEE